VKQSSDDFLQLYFPTATLQNPNFPQNRQNKKGVFANIHIGCLIGAVESSHLFIISSEGYVAKT